MSLDVPASLLTFDELARLSRFNRDLADSLDSAIGVHEAVVGYITPEQYGAVGDGVTDDLAAFKLMDAAAGALGGLAYIKLSAKTYILERDASNTYSWLVLSSNILIKGVKGRTWLKHPGGMPNTSVAVVRLTENVNITFRDVGFDGNWGNAVTTIEEASHNVALPQAIINAHDTSDFPSSGTIYVPTTTGLQTVTYTGTTAATFTGCSGGTGKMAGLDKIGRFNSQDGGNHTTQSDPRNYLLMMRGAENITIDNCRFRQAYGDCIWMGGSSTNHLTFGKNYRVVNSDFNISARDGIALANSCDRIYVGHCSLTNIFAQAFDSEPAFFPVRNVTVHGNHFGGWWTVDGRGAGFSPMSLVGGSAGTATAANAALNWRVTDNTIEGTVECQYMWDLVFHGNRIIQDWNIAGLYGMAIYLGGGDISVADNYFYSRCRGSGADGAGDTAALSIVTSADGNGSYDPANVQVHGNKFRVSNSKHGINLQAVGGIVTTATGTASAITDTTLTCAGAFTGLLLGGCKVRVGSSFATIKSNDNNTLTLLEQIGVPGLDTTPAWVSYIGNPVSNPAAGAFTVSRTTGMVDIYDNDISLTDEGDGAGANGIYITQGSQFGTRVRVRHNKIRNATGAGILVQWHTTHAMKHLEIDNNFGYDDQATHTMLSVVGSVGTPLVTKWVMPSMTTGENVPLAFSNQFVFTAAASTDQLAITQHGLSTGNGPCYLQTSGSGVLPTGVVAGTPYWVIKINGNAIKLATSAANAAAGTAIDLTADSVATCTIFVNGPIAGTWLEHDGPLQAWAGVGSPEGVVTAPVASVYRRLDGVPGTTQYNKASGQTSTGWRAMWAGTETKTTGALTPSILVSMMTTSGTKAYTLADGDLTMDGMVKKFVVTAVTATPAGTLTPTHLADGTVHTITWSAMCSFELMWDNTNTTWRVIGTPNGATVN